MDFPPVVALVSALGVTAVATAIALALALSRKGRSESEARAYLLGVSYVLEGDPDAAIAELSRAAQLNTQTLETYFALGALFRRKGELDRALRLHQNMLLRPGLTPEIRRRAQLELATDYRRAGLNGRAQEVLEKLLLELPDHLAASVELRRIHEEAGDWERAAELQARLLDREGSGGRRVLAHHLAALSSVRRAADPSESLALAKKAVEIAPEAADAQLALGQALLGRGEGAEAALRRAIELEPELAPVRLDALVAAIPSATLEPELAALAGKGEARSAPYALALALFHKWQGKPQQAVDELKRLVDARPRFWEARKELGALLLATDRAEELRADYEEILATLGKPPLGFVCSACSQKLLEHVFRCPSCNEWDAVAREEASRAGI